MLICRGQVSARSKETCSTTTGPTSSLYPKWQAWLRDHQPPTLVAWGEHDPSFIAPGAEAFRRDLPNADIHLLDAGHFALDEKTDEIADLILQFMAKHPG